MKDGIRVLVLAPHYTTFVKGLVEAIAADGGTHQIVLVRYNPLTEIAGYFSSVRFFEHVKRFSKDSLMDMRDIPPNVQAHSIPIWYLTPDGSNHMLGDRLFHSVRRTIRRRAEEYDIIHAHFTYPYGYTGRRLKEELGIPLVVTVHESSNWFSREIMQRAPRVLDTWKRADALIRVNKQDIPALRVYNQSTFHVPNGFSPERIERMEKNQARKALGISMDKKVLFNLSGLYPYKGQQYLIDSMRRLVNVRSDVLCFIGGSGPMRHQLQVEIKRLDLERNVRLLGFVPDEIIGMWMSAADVFVLPSVSEGNPTVMFEALGCGTPFVGSRIGGVPEVVNSEEYGLLSEPADANDLSIKLLDALARDWNTEKIARYGGNFEWSRIQTRVMEIYEKTLSTS